VYVHSSFDCKEGEEVSIQLEKPFFIKAIRHFLENSTVTQKASIMDEIDQMLSMNLTGNFFVKQVFSDAMGKFPIG
jgi:hypothetical protein